MIMPCWLAIELLVETRPWWQAWQAIVTVLTKGAPLLDGAKA